MHAAPSPFPVVTYPMRAYSVAAVLMAVLASSLPAPLPAQVIRADSTVHVRMVHPEDTLATSVSNTVTLSATARRYTIGGTPVRENVAPFEWLYASPHLALTLSGTPLQFTAQPTTVNAWIPVQMQADVVPKSGDTLSVYGRTASTPLILNTAQVDALGAVSTAVLDLSSLYLGTTAQVGVRGVYTMPVGDLLVGVSTAVEQDMRPRGGGAVYYQGTTVRGALTANARVGTQLLTLSGYMNYSRADSLGGQNQFPGGGARGLTGAMSGVLSHAQGVSYTAEAYYEQPYDNVRNDQPTRLIPNGTYAGWTGTLDVERRHVTWKPTLGWSHEASSQSIQVGQGAQRARTTMKSSAWSTTAALSAEIAVGHGLVLTPEVGTASGSANWSIAAIPGRVVPRRGRAPAGVGGSSEVSSLRGVWSGVGLSWYF